MLWLLFKDMPNTTAKKGECPYLQPDSENTKIRSLLGCMVQEYGWNYELLKDFNFVGGFSAKMQLLREQRSKEYPTYATGSKVQIANVDTTEEIDLTKFDEKNDVEFTRKCLLCFGCFLTFRGLQEHTQLRQNQVEFGYFERGHELEGHMWVRATHLNDKSTKLSFTKGRMRDTKRDMRLPVDPTNLSCPGGTIFRYAQALAPGGDRFYTYPVTLTDKKSYEMMQLGREVRYSSDRPLGKGTIGKYIKAACEQVNLDCTGHGLRAVGVSTVVNTMGSTAETLAFSRHSSVSGQKPYHRKNNKSEMQKFNALGVGGALRNKPAAKRTALPNVDVVGRNERPAKRGKTNDSASASGAGEDA